MKIKHFLALAAMTAMGGGSAWAEITSGTDYLIQNVQTGYYFAGGRDYGTHGTLLAKPQFFTFTTNGSGYSLDSHQYNNATNHFLGTNLYVDGGATAWNVVETSTPGVYTIENGGNYLAGNGFNANIKTVTDANDAAAQWKLISKADIVALQESATIASPLDVTAFIKAPEFKRNSNASQYPTWTVKGADGTGTPSNYAFGGGDKVANCAESYHANNGFDFSQTISDLKAGTYRFDAKGFYSPANNSGAKPYVFVDDDKSELCPIQYGENSMAGAYTSFLEGKYSVEPIYFHVDENGSVKIGVHGETNASLWNIWGELGLTYYGNVSLAEVVLAGITADYRAALADAQAIDQEAKMNSSVLSALQTALATYPEATVLAAGATQESITEAKNALATAAADASTSISIYAAAPAALTAQKALIDGTNVYASEWSTYIANYETQKAAYDGNTLNEAVVNPNAATGWHASTAYNALLTPWTFGGEPCNNFDKALDINTWSVEGDTDGSNFQVPFFEFWVADDQNLPNKELAASVTGVDNGLYSVSVLVRTRAKNNTAYSAATGINLSVNGGTPVDVTKGDQINQTDRAQFGLNTFTAEGLVKDGTLNIKFNVENTNISWLAYKNVKYTKVRDLTPEEQIVYATAAEIEEFNAAIEAAEAKTVGFKAGNYSPYTNADAIAALADAKAINTSVPVDVEVINAAKAAIADANWTVNAEEVNAINNGDLEGTYAAVAGAGVSADRDIFLPTGWKFRKNGINTNDIVVLKTSDKAGNNVTAISALDNGGNNTLMYRGKWGNTTNLDFYQSITLPAGAYYLECDAWKSGLGGDGKIYVGANNEIALDGNETSWRKLYLSFVLDEEKTVEVGFNIKHNSDGSEKLLGFDNFVLKSIPESQLAINITEANQYGTFIAPFDAELPTGVKAYTVSATEGDVLTLKDAASIKANTAYILENTTGSDISETVSGYQMTKTVDNSYTTGLLTGVYTKTDVPSNANNYILLNGNEGVGFYKVEGTYTNNPTVGANRCYLTLPAQAQAAPRALRFSNGTVTEIEASAAALAIKAIYNANGVKLNSLQKGLNIVEMENGETQKILVK